MEKHITNCPTEPLRWSLQSACREFAINRTTLQRRFSETGIIAGQDGLYSTRDIMSAIIGGSISAEKLRKVKGEADNLELKNAERRRDSLPATEVYSCLEKTFIVMRQEILGSGIPEDLKRSLLSHLAEIEVPA